MTLQQRLSNPAVAGSIPAGPTSLSRQSLPAANNDLTPSPEFLRRRYLVLPTGRTVFAWGVWDTDFAPLGSIAQIAPRTEDWVSRHRNMSLAYWKAAEMNRVSAQKVAA